MNETREPTVSPLMAQVGIPKISGGTAAKSMSPLFGRGRSDQGLELFSLFRGQRAVEDASDILDWHSGDCLSRRLSVLLGSRNRINQGLRLVDIRSDCVEERLEHAEHAVLDARDRRRIPKLDPSRGVIHTGSVRIVKRLGRSEERRVGKE